MEQTKASPNPETTVVYDIVDPTCDWMQKRISFIRDEVYRLAEEVKEKVLEARDLGYMTNEAAAEQYLVARRRGHDCNKVTQDYRTRTMKRAATLEVCYQAEQFLFQARVQVDSIVEA